MAVTTTNSTIKNANLSTWSPTTLFAAGEQGAWYDPSDLNTMFQDSAATTPVTAVEQPVGLIRDKSGRGNNASQSTSASRPVLSARYNLLTKTEQFNDTAWPKNNCTVSADQTTAPDGTLTADKLISSTTANVVNDFYQTFSIASGTICNFSIYAKSAGYDYCWLEIIENSTPRKRYFVIADLVNGVAKELPATNSPTNTSYSITNVGNNWCKISATMNITNGNPNCFVVVGVSNTYSPTTDAVGEPNITGNGTSGIYIWGASLTVSNDGVAIPYQRVNTSTDYDSNPNLFPYYLKFDGVDDALEASVTISTLNLNFWTGCRPTGTTSSNTRAFWLGDTTGNTNICNLVLNGGTPSNNNVGYRLPENQSINLGMSTNATIVVSYQRASTTSQAAKLNAVSLTTNTNSTTTFNSDRWRIGSSITSSVNGEFFPGRIYSLIVRGASSTAAQISNAEQWVNGKTKAY